MNAWQRRVVAALALLAIGCSRVTQPMAGTVERQLVMGGVRRTYLMHAGGTTKRGGPLLLVLHGWKHDAASIEKRTKGAFDRLADRDGAVVVYPQALGDPRWNDGEIPADAHRALPDDLAFLAALIDTVGAEFSIDRKRVFAAGLSNGASMVYRLACERPELVAAVAAVSGTMSGPVASHCSKGTPVSLIAMHGTDDPIVPFGTQIRNDLTTWTRRNGCPIEPIASRLPDVDPEDGTQTRVERYEPCAAGTAVAVYTIEGGGHAWPGGEAVFGLVRRGKTARDFDAGDAIWEFFEQHSRR